MRKILSYIKVVFASIGAIMVFLNETISRFGNNAFQITPQQIQQIGLVLFVLAVLWNMISAQAQINKQEARSPKLSWREPATVFKHAFKGSGTQREKIGEWHFAVLSIANEPDDWDNGQSAEKTTAELIFKSNEGLERRIEYGRWWDKDIPLFPPFMVDVKTFKQKDIDPGHPEVLVLAFRKKRSRDIYAFYYNDHINIEKLYKERKVGKPPIDVAIKLRGRFKPKEFRLTLDIDEKGNFIVTEKPHSVFGIRKSKQKMPPKHEKKVVRSEKNSNKSSK